jgi:hypothetical protein
MAPHGLPGMVPYRYRGTDFSVDAEVITLPQPAPPRRRGPPAIDPAGPPVSAPAEYLAWWRSEMDE